MKFDIIIIGGGLSGLVAGIELQRKGRKCLVVSAGQSALHFFSGSFELCNSSEPYAKALENLPESHPYSALGAEKVLELAARVPGFFAEAGITLNGDNVSNHYRITPLGVLKPAWLTLDGYASVPSDGKMPWKKVSIVNLEGYLDFHPDFLASGLAKKGVESKICTVSLPELDRLRANPTEMRSTNIARALVGEALGVLANKLSSCAAGTDAVLMPAVLGLEGPQAAASLKARTDIPVEFVATLPPSVPGIRTQLMLRSYFQKLGGTYMLGDTVTGGKFNGDRLVGVKTVNHAETLFEADDFILATGSFFSRGVKASQEEVFDPVFGVDIDFAPERSEWYKANMFERQPYMEFGIRTGKDFRVSKGGKTVSNLYAAGSALSGFNGIKDGCGAGVSILTALNVADIICR